MDEYVSIAWNRGQMEILAQKELYRIVHSTLNLLVRSVSLPQLKDPPLIKKNPDKKKLKDPPYIIKTWALNFKIPVIRQRRAVAHSLNIFGHLFHFFFVLIHKHIFIVLYIFWKSKYNFIGAAADLAYNFTHISTSNQANGKQTLGFVLLGFKVDLVFK